MSLQDRRKEMNYSCEICGSNTFYVYTYPTDLRVLKTSFLKKEFSLYVINPTKYIIRKVLFFPVKTPWLAKIKKKANNISFTIKSPKKILDSLKKLDTGIKLFVGKQIIICTVCDIGTVLPRISEKTLVDFYARDYWLSNDGILESCEDKRTTSTYDLLNKFISFKDIRHILEFGSASAQISRFFKLREPHLIVDCVDQGLVWQEKLRTIVHKFFIHIKDVPDATYDLVCSSHALEHVSDILMYLRDFNRILKPGGLFYFEVPNSEEKEVIFGDTPDYHFPHTYFFTDVSLKQLAESCSFEIIFTKTFSRSYQQRFSGTDEQIDSTEENPRGARLRVLLRKKI